MTASNRRPEPAPAARSAIISAAEHLFAADGIEGVSLREIMRAAGQRNTTSLQYHFGDRDGLLRALVEKHTTTISLRRDAILEHLESREETSLRDSCAALVQPIVAKLSDPDGGPEFLQIAAQLINRANQVIDPAEPTGALIYDGGGSLSRWSRAVEELMPHGTAGSPLHRRFAAIRFTHIEAGRRAASSPNSDHALFSSQLTDLCSALLGAEISKETRRLLDERQVHAVIDTVH